MTLRQILNIFKQNDFADREELAGLAGVKRQSLTNMITRNDMKLSMFLKIVNGEGYSLILTDGDKKYELENLEESENV